MSLELPPLPFDRSALEPHVPGEAVDRLRHHQRLHLSALAALMPGTPSDADTASAPVPVATLADIVRTAQGVRFHHAALAWNIDFCLRGLAPVTAGGGAAPVGDLPAAITQRFGTVAALCMRFDATVREAPAPGWTWLVRRREGGLGIVRTAQAATPLTGEDLPLLAHWSAGDVGEGDQALLPLEAFWRVVEWRAVSARWAVQRR